MKRRIDKEQDNELLEILKSLLTGTYFNIIEMRLRIDLTKVSAKNELVY